jgi:hypothetical protein
MIKKSTTINDLVVGKFEIYPNPNNGKFTLKMEISEPASVSIFDLNGRKILNIKDVVNEQELDISHLNGIYIIQIETQYGTTFKKLIIQH